MVTSSGMKALYGLFSGSPKPTSLNAELNAQIVTVSITAATLQQHYSNITVTLQQTHSNLVLIEAILFVLLCSNFNIKANVFFK